MESFKKNIAYNSIYRLVVIITPLITSPYISRVLGAEKTGIYTYCNAFATYFVVIAMLGVNSYGNRRIAQVRDDRVLLSKEFSNIFYLQLSLGMLMTIAYSAIVFIVFNDYINIRLLFIIFVLTAAFDINWFAFGLEEFRFTSIRSIICRIIVVFCIFAFVHTKEDLTIYAAILIIGNTINVIPVWRIVHKRIKFYKPSFSEIIKHIKPNLILFLPVIATTLYQQVDKLMLGFANLEEEVGYYQNAENIITLPTFITNAIVTVMLPYASNLIAKGQKKENLDLLQKTLKYSSVLNIAMMFGMIAISDKFIPWYLGEGYERSAELVKILSPIIFVGGFSSVIRYQYLIPNERDKAFTLSIVSGAIINILVNIILIPKYQAVGAAIATIISYLAVLFIQSIITFKEIQYFKMFKSMIPYIAIGIMMYLSIHGINHYLSFRPIIVITTDIIVGTIVFTGLSYTWMKLTNDSLLLIIKKRISK